jgi:hypothetical protein
VNEGGILVAPPQMVDIIEEAIAEPEQFNQFSTFSL